MSLIKMKELISVTGETKSTILYYVKEGLLPPPHIKSKNVHLYDATKYKEIFKLIKFFQKEFNLNIEDLKILFSDFNRITNNKDLIDKLFDMILKLNTLGGLTDVSKLYAEICTEIELKWIIDNFGLTDKTEYNKKDIEFIESILSMKKINLDLNIIKKYIKSADIISKEEAIFINELKKNIENIEEIEPIELLSVLFSSIYIIKPYIYNRTTLLSI
jgi:DNA-binding transcriptional MerR regulator